MPADLIPAQGMTVHVSVFGKHPGWPDDIEDIGLTCEELARAKRSLYTMGLGVNAATGAWDKLPPEQRTGGFRHAFVWKLGKRVLIGRIWTSRDGKGRAVQPMIACAAVDGLPRRWTAEHVGPVLEGVESKAGQTSSPELVRLAVGEARRAIEEAGMLASAAAVVAGDEKELIRTLVEHPALGPDRARLVGIMEDLHRQLESGGESRAFNLRVPRCHENPFDAALSWVAAAERESPDGLPILAIVPLERRFVDLILGEPRAGNLMCVRQSEQAQLPQPQPAKPDAAAHEAAKRRIDAWVAEAAPEPPPTREGGGYAKLVLVALLVLAGTLALWKFWPSHKPPALQSSGPGAQAPQGPPDITTTANAGGVRTALDAAGDALAKLESENAAEGREPPVGLRARFDEAARRYEEATAPGPGAPQSRQERQRNLAETADAVAAIRQDIDTELSRSRQRLSAALDDKTRRPPFSTPPVQRAWATAVRAIDPAEGWKAANQALAEAKSRLTEAESRTLDATRLSPPPIPGVDAGALARAIESGQNRWLGRAASAALAGSGLDDAVNGARAWASDAAELLSAAAAASSELAQAYAPSETGPDRAAPLGGSLQKMQTSPVASDFAPALRPLLDAIASYASLAADTNVPGLIDTVARAAGPGATADAAARGLAAWQRLSELNWPATRDDLARAAQLSDAAQAGAGAISPAERAAVLRERARRTTASMWSSYVARAATGEEQAAAFPLMPRFGVTPDDAKDMPAWAKANLARWKLLEAVRESASQDPARRLETLRAAGADFLASLDSLGSDKGGPIAAMAAKLRPALDPWAALDFRSLGPGVAGWQVLSAADDGSEVTYATRTGRRPGELTFRRLPPAGPSPAPDRVTYLATVETSVAMFSDATTRAGAWDDVAPIVCAAYPVRGVDPRRGVRSWDWGRRSTDYVVPAWGDPPSNGWMRSRPGMQGRSYFSASTPTPENAPPPPAWDDPMNYVSPVAALYAAKTLGCRLPTTDEWRAAVAAGPGAPSGANLRDPAWAAVFEAVAAQATSLPEYPSAGIFWPRGSQPPLPEHDAALASTTPDRTAFFEPVTSGPGPFHHLLGNVAEYTFDDPKPAEALTPLSVEGVRGVIGDGTALRVVGASALSSLAPDPATVNMDEAPDGFADVGFRVAFTADRNNVSTTAMIERLQTAVAAGAWLDRPK